MKRDLVLVLLALGVMWYALRDRDTTIRRLTVSADSLAQAVTDSAAVYAKRRAADSVELGNRARLITTLRGRVTTSQAATDSLLGRILPDSGPLPPHDSLLGRIAELRMLVANERIAAANIIAYQDSTIGLLSAQVRYWRDTAMVAQSQALDVQRRLLREALEAKRPSHFWRGVAVGGAVVGIVVASR